MSGIIKKIKAGLKKFVFGEDGEQLKGKVYIVTPYSRVKFEADLTVEDDFDRAVTLLANEKKIMFVPK